MELQKLEFFRDNDYDEIVFLLATSPPTMLQINYDLLAIHAYRFTTRCLRELEHSQQSINNGLDQLPAISMWYQSIDSFLNSLLHVSCLRSGMDFEQLSQCSLAAKYEHLLSLVGIVKTEQEQEMREILADFSLFETATRRSFMNGFGNNYNRAKFSTNPMKLNQADVLQSMLIAVRIFESFRFIIAGLDLMPQISIQVSDKILFDRLDLLLHSIIVPSVKDILSKQKLSLSLDLETSVKSYPAGTLFKEKEILVIGKVVEDDQYKRPGGLKVTNIIGHFFGEYAKKFDGNEDRFKRNYLAPGFLPLKEKKNH